MLLDIDGGVGGGRRPYCDCGLPGDQIRKPSFAVKHSPTKVVVLWFDVCKQLGVKLLCSLCNVRACWGLTERMLDCTLAYKAVIDEVCKDKTLCQYEIEKTEWDVLANLWDLLKVRTVHLGHVCVGVGHRRMLEHCAMLLHAVCLLFSMS